MIKAFKTPPPFEFAYVSSAARVRREAGEGTCSLCRSPCLFFSSSLVRANAAMAKKKRKEVFHPL